MNLRVVVLAGPTAVGKSATASFVCKLLNKAEIVVADSVQVYEKLDIGSAKPTALETAAIPHHLLNIGNNTCKVTPGVFYDKAIQAIKEINQKGNVAVVVGGATMWLDWLLHGKPGAPPSSNVVREQANALLSKYMENHDWNGAVDILLRLNSNVSPPRYPNNWKQLSRCIEIAMSDSMNQGTGFASAREGGLLSLLPTGSVRSFFIAPKNRHDLFHRIDQRCLSMIHAGLLEETRALVDSGYLLKGSDLSKSIGYRQTIDYLTQTVECTAMDRQSAGMLLKSLALTHPKVAKRIDAAVIAEANAFFRSFGTATRNYAKYQMQWFRRDESFLWTAVDSDPGAEGDSEQLAKQLVTLSDAEHVSDDLFRSLCHSQYAIASQEFQPIVKTAEDYDALLQTISAKWKEQHPLMDTALLTLLDPSNRCKEPGYKSDMKFFKSGLELLVERYCHGKGLSDAQQSLVEQVLLFRSTRK